MVTANPHGDWEAHCERMQQESEDSLARSGHREHAGDGPIAEGWQLTVGYGHSGFGIYAHMEEYPEEGSIFWRSLNDVQTDAYAEGRKDEREALAEPTEAMIEAGKDERMECLKLPQSPPISVGEALTRIYQAMLGAAS
jgi:hypothetical protein